MLILKNKLIFIKELFIINNIFINQLKLVKIINYIKYILKFNNKFKIYSYIKKLNINFLEKKNIYINKYYYKYLNININYILNNIYIDYKKKNKSLILKKNNLIININNNINKKKIINNNNNKFKQKLLNKKF
jgi:hypothetical protein